MLVLINSEKTDFIKNEILATSDSLKKKSGINSIIFTDLNIELWEKVD